MASLSSVSLLPRLTVGACLTTVRQRTAAAHLYLSRRREMATLSVPGASARERTLSEMARVEPSGAETAGAATSQRTERLSLDFPLSLFRSLFLPFLTLRIPSLSPESSRATTARPHARRARQGVSRCRYLRLTDERKEIRLPGRRITRPSARETRHGAYGVDEERLGSEERTKVSDKGRLSAGASRLIFIGNNIHH